MDAGGRTLGVLDMLGGQDDGEGNTSGAWTWYAFGGQRLAKTTPNLDQQPDILTRDLARKANADVNEAIYQALITYIYAENQANGGLEYPLSSVMLKTAPGQYQMIDAEVYAQNVAADSTFALFLHQKYTFQSSRDQVSVKRFDSPKVLLLSVEELLGDGKAKSGSNGVPFYYLPAEFDTRLPEVTYYLHDHLGNMRVTYSIPCVEGTQVPTLMHAADYYAYGSILREYVYGRQEKYLTTHHERDQETGLDYRGARYYDSDVARFLSLDPAQAEYPAWNPYQYVLGNPISFTDPTGKRVDGYVDEEGNYLGDDGSTTSHETRVIDKAKWEQLKGARIGQGKDNATIDATRRTLLQSEGMRLDQWHHSINIGQGTWDKLVAHGGQQLLPYVSNNSPQPVFFKPGVDTPDQTIHDDGAYPVQPGHQIYAAVDGIKTAATPQGKVFKVPNDGRVAVGPMGLPAAIGFTPDGLGRGFVANIFLDSDWNALDRTFR